MQNIEFILIGNYPPDKQESMKRFALMLNTNLHQLGYKSVIWNPVCIFTAFTSSTLNGYGKWLAYIDKWVVFPLILRWRSLTRKSPSAVTYYHICDHSNAPYLAHLPKNRTGITCHDVLAIRGAMGYEDAYCPASSTGKILQKWILRNLASAKILMADSASTLDQLNQLVGKTTSTSQKWQVVHIGFNEDFRPLDSISTASLLKEVGLLANESFLLCVGSGLPRKNRKLLVDMVVSIGSEWNGRICYAGQAIDPALMAYATSLGLADRLISVLKPDHATLLALYTGCEAFIFPSFSEGFGWPLIEAQACGAPVIASSIEPMPEISGGAALHADPHDAATFAEAFRNLQTSDVRENLVREGLVNCRRFTPIQMTQKYLEIYEQTMNKEVVI